MFSAAHDGLFAEDEGVRAAAMAWAESWGALDGDGMVNAFTDMHDACRAFREREG